MIDFAHNPAGFLGIKEFLKHIDSPYKIGVIAGTGDRRDEDIRELGAIAAGMFDYIILYQAHHLRGRSAENILGLMEDGIRSVDAGKAYEIVANNDNPVFRAMQLAKPGSFIVALSEVVLNGVSMVQNYLEQEQNGKLVL
jgi:cyanophycin synthetase